MLSKSVVIHLRRPLLRRSLRCSFSSEESSNHAFDRNVKRLQRDNAARAHNLWRSDNNINEDDDKPIDYDYFQQEIARRVVDRLDDIRRDDGFPLALEIGAGSGILHKLICSDDAFGDAGGGIGGIRKLVQLDSSELMLHRDQNLPVDGSDRCGTFRLHADEEAKMPFPDGTFDLVISSAAMHWVNELPNLFREIKRVLKPDGCFIFSMIGGTTLPELRASMVLSESEREGGVSPHVGPFVELSDVGSLVSAAGFDLPTIDVDSVKFSYPNAMVLMEHLQRMGEGNACINRRPRTAADTFLATACVYDSMFPLEGDDVDIEASVQIIYAIGWTPHESQQQPLERGTATYKVGDMVEFSKVETEDDSNDKKP